METQAKENRKEKMNSQDQMTIDELEDRVKAVDQYSFLSPVVNPATILALCARVKAMEKALKFYAEDPWDIGCGCCSDDQGHMFDVQGELAVKTLKSHGSDVPLEIK